ncbi:MAG: hypothetical protein IPN71_14645 [Fibrobacteres bacterium]|nr:hypothetical protein [Fibrobacterota bacterium]
MLLLAAGSCQRQGSIVPSTPTLDLHAFSSRLSSLPETPIPIQWFLDSSTTLPTMAVLDSLWPTPHPSPWRLCLRQPSDSGQWLLLARVDSSDASGKTSLAVAVAVNDLGKIRDTAQLCRFSLADPWKSCLLQSVWKGCWLATGQVPYFKEGDRSETDSVTTRAVWILRDTTTAGLHDSSRSRTTKGFPDRLVVSPATLSPAFIPGCAVHDDLESTPSPDTMGRYHLADNRGIDCFVPMRLWVLPAPGEFPDSLRRSTRFSWQFNESGSSRFSPSLWRGVNLQSHKLSAYHDAVWAFPATRSAFYLLAQAMNQKPSKALIEAKDRVMASQGCTVPGVRSSQGSSWKAGQEPGWSHRCPSRRQPNPDEIEEAVFLPLWTELTLVWKSSNGDTSSRTSTLRMSHEYGN